MQCRTVRGADLLNTCMTASHDDASVALTRVHACAGLSIGRVAASTSMLSLWDQCGGKGGNCQAHQACADAVFPSTSCPSGSTCQRLDEWYHQCREPSSTPSACGCKMVRGEGYACGHGCHHAAMQYAALNLLLAEALGGITYC
jgi:hypothetical protein